MSFYNTVDVDTNDKVLVRKIMLKIVSCPYLFMFEQEFSESKGVHFKLWCLIICDKCRLVFDDPIRFAYDQFREPYSRNVLFQKKEYINAKKQKRIEM